MKTFAAEWEHVILADCTNPKTAVRISHMAYYPQTLTSLPATVTVVESAFNETVLWTNETLAPISATFPDAVTFSVNLTHTNKQGDFAGTSILDPTFII